MTRFWIILFALFGTVFLRAEDVSVSAQLSPEEITLGQAARLQIVIQGGQKVDRIQAPSVENLQIDHVSEASNFQFVNGVVSSSVTHIYSVVPTSTGDFQIPSFEVVVKGNVYKTSSFSLKVAGDASPPPSQSQAARQPSMPASSQRQNSSMQTKLAFLQIHLPKKEFYVGERIPIEIKAYFVPGQRVSLNSLPVLTSEAFTFSEITDKYRQSEEVVDGQNYVVLTWNNSMDAIKQGEYALDGRLECVMVMRRQSAFPGARNMFEDFFGVLEQKPLTLRLPAEKYKILSLPEQGKPANFSGAVGHFQMQTSAQPAKLAAGDPVTLTMTVTGKGNFERLTAPKLTSEDGWKTYTPTAKFESADAAGFEGRKIFEQAIIPQKTGSLSLPSVELNYFDPEEGQYKKIETSPIALQVEASAAASVSQMNVPQNSTVNLSASSQNAAMGKFELAPNKIELGSLKSDVRPLILRNWFVILKFILLVVLAGATILRIHQDRRMRDPHYLRSAAISKEMRAQIEHMEHAEKKGSVSDFFFAARKVLQYRLAEIWNVKADAITIAEVKNRLPYQHRLHEIFEIADSVAYADGAIHSYNLPEWRAAVEDELSGLGRSK